MKKKIYFILTIALLLVANTLVSDRTVSAAPQTFTVNSTLDGGDSNPGNGTCETATPGQCTLRAAVEEANSNGNPSDQDIIEFNIPGSGLHTISLSSGNSIVVQESVLINGYTEPGAVQNTNPWPSDLNGTLLIEIEAPSSAAVTVESDNVSIRGLIINNSADTLIQLSQSSFNTEVKGCYLNTDASGLIATNGSGNFSIASSPGTGDVTIGGSNAEDRNVITGRRLPINLTSLDPAANVDIKGNNIGIGGDSVTPLPNIDVGISLLSIRGGSSHQIGGDQAGEGNYISNGLGSGIDIGEYTSAIVSGNIVSDNTNSGLSVGSITGNTQNTSIGGDSIPERNVFIGNGSSGIRLISEAGVSSINSTTITGNYIGVDADGQTAVGNGSGVELIGDISNTTIGGLTSPERNLISGNTNSGIGISGGGENLEIIGNYIGTESAGLSALPNGIGINFDSATLEGTLAIGSTINGGENVISGNNGVGISLNGTSTAETSVIGNYIGVGQDGTSALPNDGAGVIIQLPYAVVGGTSSGQPNIIANNGGAGVSVVNLSTSGSILSNQIFNNTGLGIDLVGDGVTANDLLDPDEGPNDLLNSPRLLPPVESGGDTDITYRLDVPAGDYRVEFFENTAYDSSGSGEGENFLSSQVVTSLGSGPQLFTTTITGDSYTFISANVTAIDVSSFSGFGATSEFSSTPGLDYDIALTKSVVDQTTIVTNSTISYDITVENQGADPVQLSEFTLDALEPLESTLFVDLIDPNLSFSSASAGLDCSEQNPASNFGDTFEDNLTKTVLSCGYSGAEVSLDPDETLNFTLNFSVVNPALPIINNQIIHIPDVGEESYTDYLQALTNTQDVYSFLSGGSSNNVDNATTTQPQSDTAATKTLLTAPGDVSAGGTLEYNLTFTNNGPDALYLGDNATPFSSNALFSDYLHPDLSVNSSYITAADTPFPGVNQLDVGNPDLTCAEAEAGSAGVFLGWTENADYGFIACWYTGAAQSLADDGTIAANILLDVNPLSDLSFANYMISSANMAGSQDPDEDVLEEGYSSGADLLDGLQNMTDTQNNFVTSPLPVDLTLTSEIIDPPSTVTPGTEIRYEVTIQNDGPAAFNFAHYNGAGQLGLLTLIFSGEDLNLVGPEDPSLYCVDFGEGSAAVVGTAAQDHEGYNYAACASSGSDIVIQPGQSSTITILFEVKDGSDGQFSFYALANSAESDPDLPSLLTAIFTASEDILDTIESPNYTRVGYSGTYIAPPTNPGDEGSGSSSNQGLSSTGESNKLLILLATTLVLLSLIGAVRFSRQKQTK
jgi:CSLREA domain-containing protein